MVTVVQMRPRGGRIAAGVHTPAVTDTRRPALVRGREPHCCSEVQRHAQTVDDERMDGRITQELAGRAVGEPDAVRRAGVERVGRLDHERDIGDRRRRAGPGRRPAAHEFGEGLGQQLTP